MPMCTRTFFLPRPNHALLIVPNMSNSFLPSSDVLPFLQFGPLDVVIDRDFFSSSWVSVYFLKGFEWVLGTIRVAHLGPDQRT
jgi:hypothetical protein